MMIHQKTLEEYFKEELENLGRLTILLYRDKKMLREGRYEEFATEFISKSRKSYYVTLAIAFFFCLIGIMQIVVQGNVWLGVAYIGVFPGILNFATKEYYKVWGSMTLLLKIIHDSKTEVTLEAERAKAI